MSRCTTIKRLRIASFNSSDGGGYVGHAAGAAPALPRRPRPRGPAAAVVAAVPGAVLPAAAPHARLGAHPAAAAAGGDDDGAAYSEVNSLLRSLHLERVAKGRQKEWVEDEE